MSVREIPFETAEGCAAALRGLVPVAASVSETVTELIAGVRRGGHDALTRYAEEFDGAVPGTPLRVSADELQEALTALDPQVRAGLQRARDTIGRVAAAGLMEDRPVDLGPGHRVTVREVPVRRAAIYAPGGRNPYPSTVLMGAVTAKVAGVSEIVVCVPGGHPVMLAACALCEVAEVWRIGGAHAIAALGYGTAELAPVDVVAGPGNLYVQEAKRLLAGDRFGVDGFAGPSDLLVLAAADAPADCVAADLRAQAEHGAGSVVALVTDSGELADAVAADLRAGPSIAGAAAIVRVPGPEEALAVAESFAPEHLELIGTSMEALTDRVTRAGCTFVGPATGVAFGDYIAGANHTLPTAGAARFASVMSVRTFRRLTSVVELDAAAAAALAEVAAPIAEAEGFSLHAESMRLRQNPSS